MYVSLPVMSKPNNPPPVAYFISLQEVTFVSLAKVKAKFFSISQACGVKSPGLKQC